ncbi:hypothetical protein HON22_01885 [Candidatus Peregrinibacteria bacterium]|nr:hypothetical protein [Candidatus Peregrinibacteria bacterium]
MDDAGNNVSATKVVEVFPGQMDTSASTLTLGTECNNASWLANASSTCSLSGLLKDSLDNPLYSRGKIQINGTSATQLDQIHGSGEAISFSTDTGNDITTNQIPSVGTDGTYAINLIAYAPGSGNMNFTISAKNHTTENYSTIGTGADVQDNENGKAYQVTTLYNPASWDTEPSSYVRNADLRFELDMSGLVSAVSNTSGEASRIGVYVYDSDKGTTFNQNHNNKAVPESAMSFNAVRGQTDTWLASNGSELTSADDGNDKVLWLGGSGESNVYKFALNFEKQSGVLLSSANSITIKAFTHYKLNGKEVSYPLIGLDISGKSIDEQATSVSGTGLVQSSGKSVTSDSSEATKKSTGSVSIAQFNSQIKEKVKKMILDLDDTSGNTNNTISSIAFYGSDVKLVNDNKSYVMKGAGEDLVITGTGGNLSIGDEPLAFISYGGNIIIKSNIIHGGTKKPTIAFIALRNEQTGTGGEIHIENETASGGDLTDLVGSLIAERGIVGLYGTSTDLSTEDRTNLDNQLYIEGSVMSKNTLGGGDSPLTCPSFVKKVDCSIEKAQKYDLNYIRRYVDGEGAASSNNGGETNPLLIKYYINRELMPSELE